MRGEWPRAVLGWRATEILEEQTAMGRTCAICGISIRHWELCCAACTAGLAPDDPKFVLVHSRAILVAVAAFVISAMVMAKENI